MDSFTKIGLFKPLQRGLISVTLPNDEVALEPHENHVLTLSLLVPDLQVELQSYLSTLTITDGDSKYS